MALHLPKGPPSVTVAFPSSRFPDSLPGCPLFLTHLSLPRLDCSCVRSRQQPWARLSPQAAPGAGDRGPSPATSWPCCPSTSAEAGPWGGVSPGHTASILSQGPRGSQAWALLDYGRADGDRQTDQIALSCQIPVSCLYKAQVAGR